MGLTLEGGKSPQRSADMSSLVKIASVIQAPPPTPPAHAGEKRVTATDAAQPGGSAAREDASSNRPVESAREEVSRPRQSGGQSPGGQVDILEAAVEAFNSRIALANRSTKYRVSEETGEMQIQIIDNRTDEVIRSIPSEESLKIAARLRELAGSAVGALVDKSS
jgi:flagellar protein FlaG